MALAREDLKTELPVTTPIDTKATSAYTPSKITTTGSTFTPEEATETGKGVTYSGRSSNQQLASDRKGLVSMLDENNELMRLSRAEGARSSEARGLGGSSLRERASEGAAIATALPMVQQASAQGSSERMAAQQATASSQIAASQRKLQELLTNRELAVKAGDSAAARKLDAAIANENNTLSAWSTQATIDSARELKTMDVESSENLLDTQLTSNEKLTYADLKNKRDMQGIQLTADEQAQLKDIESKLNLQSNQLTSTEELMYADLKNKRDMQGIQLTADEQAQLKDIESKLNLQSNQLTSTEELMYADLQNKRDMQGIQLTAEEEAQLKDIESKMNLQSVDVESRERIANLSVGSQEKLAGLDNASRERIANLSVDSQERIVGLQLDASDQQQLLDLKSRFDLNEANLTSNEKLTLQELESREAIAQASITSQELMSQQSDDLQRELQSVDIDYKEWLAQTTFENSAILQGNQQASSAYSDFTIAAGEILNNPDTSAFQKNASIKVLKTGLTDSLLLISETAGIDLTQFLPGATTTGAGATATAALDNTSGRNTLPPTEGDPTTDRRFNRPTPGSGKLP